MKLSAAAKQCNFLGLNKVECDIMGCFWDYRMCQLTYTLAPRTLHTSELLEYLPAFCFYPHPRWISF